MAVLAKVKDSNMTFSEAATDIKLMKQLKPVRQSFVKELGLESWKQAEEMYPEHSEQLREFIGRTNFNTSEEFLVMLIYVPYCCMLLSLHHLYMCLPLLMVL